MVFAASLGISDIGKEQTSDKAPAEESQLPLASPPLIGSEAGRPSITHFARRAECYTLAHYDYLDDPSLMATSRSSPGAMLLRLWQRLAPLPGGRWLFGRLLGRYVPYTGTIRPQIQELRPGYARVLLSDCRRVRNHLNSVHAIALANLGEVTSGLAVLTGLSPRTRGIVLRLSMEYMKKARGPLMAESTTVVPEASDAELEFLVSADIHDAEGEVVARATVCWRLGPV